MLTHRTNIALLIVSGVAVILGLYSSVVTAVRTRCQAHVNEAIAQAIIARADADDQDRQSDRAESRATAMLITTVFSSTTRAQVLQAYDLYRAATAAVVKARADAEAQRREHPLPAPPSETCG